MNDAQPFSFSALTLPTDSAVNFPPILAWTNCHWVVRAYTDPAACAYCTYLLCRYICAIKTGTQLGTVPIAVVRLEEDGNHVVNTIVIVYMIIVRHNSF